MPTVFVRRIGGLKDNSVPRKKSGTEKKFMPVKNP
jgi:hypothetical protein